ncbi:MAG TPA: type VI secretion system tip protein VgrG, partial [Rhodothermales bacterium]|nr:type VI secretion system tip protein VgrG [Rhodothermales bacterium]
QVSDWDLVISRAERIGMICSVVDGAVRIAKPDASTEPVLQLTYGSGIFDLDMEMDARIQVPSVESGGWDHANQELLSGEIDNVSAPGQGNLSGSDLADVGQVDSFPLRHTGSLVQGELDAWAEAQMIKSRFSKIRGSVRVQGTGAVKSGDMVEFAGLGDRFNGKAFVSGVRQILGEGDWMTTLQIGLDPEWHVDKYPVNATPASAFHPAISGLQIGIVTSLEDPAGADRVQVRIPVIDAGDEGTWARVSTLDAGENRGSFFRPELGDEVVVGFLNDDPNHPIILGMLNSSAKPAPLTATDENHEKGFVTRSGMKVVFNDDAVSLTIETPNGNQILISDDDGEIEVTDESGNKITMSSDGISLESAKDLKLKAANEMSLDAMNLNIKASASAKLEGSASAALKSGGTTEVKGSLVQIN